MSAMFSLLTRLYAVAHRAGGIQNSLRTLQNERSAAEARNQFFIDLSHELQAPILVLKSNWEVLAGRREGDRAAALAILGKTTDQMARMVDGFLRAARLDFAGAVLNKEPVALSALIEEVHGDCVALADNAGVHFSWASDKREVAMDRDKIKEVILNLVSNALKHTDAGGAITLSGKSVGNGAEIIVRDTGTGIPLDELSHIFERFYRIRNDAAKGNGLGLHICQKIIQAHGGSISVQSKPDEGTRFVIFLP